MKKIITSILGALALSSAAYAAFDIEVAAIGDIYSLSRTVTHVEKEAATSTVADSTSVVSSSGFFPDFGGRVALHYRVVDDVLIGLALGVHYDLPFGDKALIKEKGGEAAAEGTVTDALRRASSYLTIPVQAVIKYDIVEPADRLQLYLTVRGGVGISIDVAGTAPAASDYNPNYFGGLIDAGLGIEYYGAQLELFYKGQFLGGYTAASKVADSEPAFYNSYSYSNHGICVSLGYRFSEIF